MIGINTGDPAGVGPAVTLKAPAQMDAATRAASLAAVEAVLRTRLRTGADFAPTDLPVAGAPLPFGRADQRAGDAAFRFVEAAMWAI